MGDMPENRTSEYERASKIKDSDDEAPRGSNTEPPKKKRKTAKPNSEKKFECQHEGCGKSYSRAEHLYRHQLNHTPKQIYRCDFPDCNRYFVRQDLCVRHRERHTTQGSQLQKRDHVSQTSNNAGGPAENSQRSFSDDQTGQSSSKGKPSKKQSHRSDDVEGFFVPALNSKQLNQMSSSVDNASPGHERNSNGLGKSSNLNSSGNSHSHVLKSPQQDSMGNGMWSPSVRGTGLPTTESNQLGAYGMSSLTTGVPLSPISTTNRNLSSLHSLQALRHPPSGISPYDNSHLANTVLGSASDITQSFDSTDENHIATNDPFSAAISQGLSLSQSDQYAYPTMNNSVIDPSVAYSYPIFGGDEYNRSPFALADDFTAWLFNEGSNGSTGFSPNNVAPSYGENPVAYLQGPVLQQSPLSLSRLPSGVVAGNPTSLTNLMDMPFSGNFYLSDDKRLELLEIMQNQFIERAHDAIKELKNSIFEGDIDAEGHVLSMSMLQAYILSYWYHQHAQLPILHKPTFAADKTSNLLLLAMIAIGAATLDKRYGTELTNAAAEFANFLVWHIRWEIIRDADFRPPAKLWVFQTLLLVEVYEKMYSTRALHERAHIHHDSTLTLMRRGSSLMGRSATDTPTNGREETPKMGHGHPAIESTNRTEDSWIRWIAAEGTRRVAFAAFVIDSIHCTMFGHSAKMVVNEMRLPLPCDEALWSATSPAEVGRVNSLLATNGIKPVMFLDGLKRTLSGHKVRTNTFGRTVLMAGLLSVSWHMDQRDMTMVSLGQRRSTLGQPRSDFAVDKNWKGVLLRAYDNWKRDFDEALNENTPDPDSPARLGTSTQAGALSPGADDESIFESRTVLHHLAHIAAHVNIVDCQIYAGAARLLSRSVTPNDHTFIRAKIGKWATKASARDSAFYALKFIAQVLVPPHRMDMNADVFEGYEYGTSSAILPQAFNHNRYIARDDYLLNRPWILYICILVVWCYGFALEGPILPTPRDSDFFSYDQCEADMKRFLGHVGAVEAPDDLQHIKGKNRCLGLILILKDSFASTRWELTHEASRLLDLTAKKLTGKVRPDATIAGTRP